MSDFVDEAQATASDVTSKQNSKSSDRPLPQAASCRSSDAAEAPEASTVRCSKALNENHVPATFGVDAGATVAAAASNENDNISPLKRGPIKRRLDEDAGSTSAAHRAKRSKHDHDVIANLDVPSLLNAEPTVREKAAGA